MYDSLSADYDRFVNWAKRLEFEIPFIDSQLQKISPSKLNLRVLDAACGTGMHTIELAKRGYQVAGGDISMGMIERAIENACRAEVNVEFRKAGFGELNQYFRNFDAILCLGNSLPHVASNAELGGALRDFGTCLRPGGLLIVQNRNFDAVMAERNRWMMPESFHDADEEWLFIRFYDFNPDGDITFHIITLYREEGQAWLQKTDSTRLVPLKKDELVAELQMTGFSEICLFGGLSNEPFRPDASSNLVLTARWRPHVNDTE